LVPVCPEDIEEVFAAGAPAAERVQVDEERDRLPGAEHGGVGVANIEADAPRVWSVRGWSTTVTTCGSCI
jgi:hypothetical protein